MSNDIELPEKALQAATDIYFQQRFGVTVGNYTDDPHIVVKYKKQTSRILKAFMENLD